MIATACGDSGDDSGFDPRNPNKGGTTGQGGTSGNSGGAGGSIILPDGGFAASGGSAGDGGVCSSATSKATLQPVFLAFAFDVSGSMGMNPSSPYYQPWYQKALKWDPVRDATKAFFADPASKGFSASLTFFPSNDSATWCNVASYSPPAAPNVPMTALPSNLFANALAAVEPQLSNHLATPTLAVIQGTIVYVNAQKAAKPGKYAIVLVTDGYPQACPNGNGDPIGPVVDAVRTENTTAGIRTYVIGVKNPPVQNAPDTVSNLNEIAQQGGTTGAVFIDTGDPTATTTAFKAAVDKIRGSNISCNVTIPPPPTGSTFNKQRVRVIYKSGSKSTNLTYDAACTQTNAWKYDNPANPKQIVLCGSTCTTVQADPQASLTVEFTCNDVIEVPE